MWMLSVCFVRMVYGVGVGLRVWVGESHTKFAAASSEASSTSVGNASCADFIAWSKSTLATGQVREGDNVRVEVQDRESDEFWEVFDEGAL